MTAEGRREELLEQVGAALRGAPRRRRRLLAELDDHLRDVVSAEVARGADKDSAERDALGRFGTVAEISTFWNAAERKRRVTRRRHYAALAFAAVAATGLGITQYASGKTSPPPSHCAATPHGASPPDTGSCQPTNGRRLITPSRPSTGDSPRDWVYPH